MNLKFLNLFQKQKNVRKLIVGLGNPGDKYTANRHNVGFIILDKIYEKGWHFNKKFNAEICEEKNALIVKPQTFMNNSGLAINAIASYYKIPPENICVVHDELDLPLGEIKPDFERGSAGHNGVQSIIDHLGTKKFYRLRVGIKPSGLEKRPDNFIDFVLKNFSKEEREIIDQKSDDARKILEDFSK